MGPVAGAVWGWSWHSWTLAVLGGSSGALHTPARAAAGDAHGKELLRLQQESTEGARQHSYPDEPLWEKSSGGQILAQILRGLPQASWMWAGKQGKAPKPLPSCCTSLDFGHKQGAAGAGRAEFEWTQGAVPVLREGDGFPAGVWLSLGSFPGSRAAMAAVGPGGTWGLLSRKYQPWTG